MNTTKPRHHNHIISITLQDEALAIGGLHIDFPNKRIIAKDKTIFPLIYRSMINKSFKRNNKPQKSTYEVYETHPIQSYIDAHDYLRSFNYVCAVDTNVKNGVNYTGIIIWEITENRCNDIYINCHSHISHLDKEKLGWLIAFNTLQNVVGDSKSLIITDAHQGEPLRKINDKVSPLAGHIYLSPFYSIMYASADKKNDSQYNDMIHRTDKYINKVYKELSEEDKNSHLDLITSFESFYDSLRKDQ